MVLKHVNDCQIFKLFGSAYNLTMLQGVILIDTSLLKGIFPFFWCLSSRTNLEKKMKSPT